MSTPQGGELHLTTVACSASGLVYTTEASADTGLVYTTETCAVPRLFYILGPELHLNMSNPQGPVHINYLFALLSRLTQFALLSLFFRNKQVCFAVLVSQFNVNFLCITSIFKFLKLMCSLRFVNNFLTVERVCFASKINFLLSDVFASL